MQILQIHQIPGQIMIDADPGSFSIQQPKAQVEMRTKPGNWEIHQYPLQLEIDQSRALAAYTGGGLLEVNQRIYSGFKQIYLQGIANRVEQGNRMACFYKPGNTIGEVFGVGYQSASFPEFRGPASIDNVDVHIETKPPLIEYHKGGVEIQVTTRKPEIEYLPGKLDIHMVQYPSISFIPPKIDVLM